jgi:hypothetical protein
MIPLYLYFLSHLLLCTNNDKVKVISQNQKRWDAAVETLKTTEASRIKFDRRAKFASLVGIYVDDDEHESSEGKPKKMFGVDLIVAIQPDRSSGRKLLFMDRIDGKLLGYILLETSTSTTSDMNMSSGMESIEYISTLRGMELEEDARGRGFSTLFMSVWLGLCLQADVTPATVSINKPLLALTFAHFGFTPIQQSTELRPEEQQNTEVAKKKKRKRINIRKTPLIVEVSKGNEDMVHLYCNQDNFHNMQAGFTETELRSQNLVLKEIPADPRGRKIKIRTEYVPPDSYDGNTAIYGLRLDASQGECTKTCNVGTSLYSTSAALCTPSIGTRNDIDIGEKVLKILTGYLHGFDKR